MALKLNSFPHTMFLILVIFSTFLDISSANNGPIKDPKDPKVVEIANFALKEFNKKAKHNYELREVEGGRRVSVTDGVNYQLYIVANEWDTISHHVAVVFVRSDNFKKLISFDKFVPLKN
ncbi:hypothetical protein HAX54_041101 [Datura stramonium]|uniref:Cystatin domain-containing protein n=1 Tax=Datura stramonium TaxID=4076 RepID=A0ABS8RNI1_DATST|nr:hypothetical protein [Datura stramonium]